MEGCRFCTTHPACRFRYPLPLCRCKVDGFVPHTQHVNLGIVTEPACAAVLMLLWAVERLPQHLADFNEKCLQNLYQNRLDGPITGHVLVQKFL